MTNFIGNASQIDTYFRGEWVIIPRQWGLSFDEGWPITGSENENSLPSNGFNTVEAQKIKSLRKSVFLPSRFFWFWTRITSHEKVAKI